MHIKGTDRIKGVLDLSSVGVQMEKTSVYPVSEEQLQDSNVQTALNMGFITLEGGPKKSKGKNKDEGPKTDRIVKCLNTHPRSLALSEINTEIAPQAEFELKESDLKKPHIKQAIDKQMIKVLQIIGSDSDYTESFVKMADIFDEQQAENVEQKQKEAEEFVNSLETNEELVTSENVIDEPNPPPVKKDAIKDPKRGHVIWNPAGNPVINEMKNTHVVKKDIDETIFVDKEAEQKRIDSHPVLKNKEVQQNTEVDFLTE